MKNSLNDITLNGKMLEILYGRSLVEIEAGHPSLKPVLKFSGNHAKKVTVLVNNAEYAILPEEQLSFLNKMLLACKMNTGDVAILNMAGGAKLGEIAAQLCPEKIIAFGASPQEAEIPLLTIGKFGNASYLNAPALGELAAESDEAKALKGRLWSCLKNLFEIT